MARVELSIVVARCVNKFDSGPLTFGDVAEHLRVTRMTDDYPWHVTNRFKSESVGGICVERNGRLGYAKPERIPNEKLAADLARMVGLPVPCVEIGTVVGYLNQQFAISHVHNERSRPLVSKKRARLSPRIFDGRANGPQSGERLITVPRLDCG